MSERMDGWRECADPVELAAAVAAGVEVLCVAVDGRTWETGCEDSESFRRCMANGCRYRVPASWSWSPEPPTTVTGDDLPERRVWTCKIGGRVGRLSGGADAPMRRAVADAFTAETGRPVEFCFSGWGDDLDESELAVVEDRAPDPEAIRAALVKRLTALPPPEPPAPDDLVSRARGHAETHPESRELIEELIEELLETVVRWACFAAPSPVPSRPDGVLRDAANRLRWIANSGYIEDPGIKRIIRSWVDELDATPVPPWPGAVLSGLVDEDGVPTWLAQAGQVRGGMVRCSRNLSWAKNNGGHGPGVWVEVRAPRAVPVPETERVPWWEAVGREVTDQDGERVTIEHVQCGDGAGPSVTAYNAAERRDTSLLRVPIPVRGDGTVEVLVEAGQ